MYRAEATEVQIPRKVLGIQTFVGHHLQKLVLPIKREDEFDRNSVFYHAFFSLRAADELADSGHEDVHGRYGLA
jgi:hypothetical protein